MGPNQGRTSVTRWSLFGHSRPLISSDKPPNLSIDSNHRQHTTQAVIVCPLQECVFEEWRAREATYPMCLPATPRILDPANLFCNMQCTSVCITAAGSRVAKRTPGVCPGGLPQRVCATKTENVIQIWGRRRRCTAFRRIVFDVCLPFGLPTMILVGLFCCFYFHGLVNGMMA